MPNMRLSLFVRADVSPGRLCGRQRPRRPRAPRSSARRRAGGQALDRRAILDPCECRKVEIVGDDRPAVSMIVAEVDAKTRSVRLDLQPGDARRRSCVQTLS
jgi:hypothetical protein